ncbi:DUF169 domain-containing protein [Sporofaciens sp. SGI.106]|uniref:DUF169 domain-containing protein n=1 Tax=Sporofaciens sp. SGI.106 TaxID=3420568 RepID=UPI003D000606
MYNDLTKECRIVLNLKRKIIGIKYLYIREEYDDCPAEQLEIKMTLCGLAAQAMKGKFVKAKNGCFSCQGGPHLLGMKQTPSFIGSGREYYEFGLYADMAIARQAQNGLCAINQKIYGIVMGPLEKMDGADVALFLCDTWQAMRVMQGYTYYHGRAENIGMIGNQGLCSDLIARPYFMNDINISMLCMGARISTGAEDGEVGIGMPIHLFEDVVKGIRNTINVATEEKRKKELKKRLELENMDIPLEYGGIYVSNIKKMKYPEELYEKELF